MVLEIIISGLVAFVKDSCTVNDAGKMRIVLVQGDSQEHKAMLKIPFDSLAEGKNKQPDHKEPLPGNKTLWVWYLDHEQIKFDDPPEIQVYEGHRTKNGDDYIEPTPYDDEPDDFSWTPEIHRACGIPKEKAYPRPEVKNDDLFSYTIKQDGQDVIVPFAVARFAVLTIKKTGSKPWRRTNQLTALIGELAENEEPKVFKFTGDAYQQAVADKARLAMELKKSKSGFVEISLVNPATKKERIIYLKNKDATVDVSNEPTTTQIATSPAELSHFHEYVKLLKDSETISCPVPKEVKYSDPKLAKKHYLIKSGYPVKCVMCADCGP